MQVKIPIIGGMDVFNNYFIYTVKNPIDTFINVILTATKSILNWYYNYKNIKKVKIIY
jgi:hypothetical protein